MLQVSHLSFSYHSNHVLRDVSFTADEGDFIGIIGKNGCGKSTLLSILAGVRKAASGTVTYGDVPLFSSKKRAAELIGYVPQLNPLLPELSVKDNLKLWLRSSTVAPAEREQLFEQMQLTGFFKTPVAKLSEGMKKRVSIASVLQNNPKLLIMDESSAALDLSCKDIIHHQLKAFTSNGGIILFTTHEEAEFKLCSALYILKDGALLPAEKDSDKEALIAQF